MAILQVLTIPDSRLRQKAAKIEKIDVGLLSFMDDMIETMFQSDGIAIAATQVDFHHSAIVVDMGYIESKNNDTEYESNNIVKMINPEITWMSNETYTSDEGCLSVPDSYAPVVRHRKIRYKYIDEHGQTCERSASGLEAACLQHETDHLNGILFIDHISSMRKNKIVRALAKSKKM